MKLASILSLLALAAASPLAESSPAETKDLIGRAVLPTPCTPGSQYCGWALLDGGLNWDPAVLRTLQCDALGTCDWNGKSVWNTVWYCQRAWFAVPQKDCGGNDKCKGPQAHCIA